MSGRLVRVESVVAPASSDCTGNSTSTLEGHARKCSASEPCASGAVNVLLTTKQTPYSPGSGKVTVNVAEPSDVSTSARIVASAAPTQPPSRPEVARPPRMKRIEVEACEAPEVSIAAVSVMGTLVTATDGKRTSSVRLTWIVPSRR